MPAQHTIKIYQGQTFKLNVVWKTGAEPPVPVDITGYSARMQFRRTIRSTTKLFEALSGAGGALTLGGVLGSIDLLIPAEVSTAWTFRSAVYDLELVSPAGEVTRLLQGDVEVSPEVTR